MGIKMINTEFTEFKIGISIKGYSTYKYMGRGGVPP